MSAGSERNSILAEYVLPMYLIIICRILPDFLQYESRFTPSEILLQKLASKCAWTEAEMAQVIDLLRSPQFNADDIGLDLSRKVNLFHTISYYFILLHTISYYFISFDFISHAVRTDKVYKGLI